jgi:branched-chain amino acid transport system substrate-binding protein
MKQCAERGLTKAGIKLIGPGDVTDDDILDSMGDAAIGTITSHQYSAAHPSPENKAYVAAFEKANPGMRPNFMSVGGWDGMALIYEVLKKTNGSAEGDKFIAAAKGLSWMSPRGKITIDPNTRDIIQDEYIREVKRVNGHLFNVEFDRIPAVPPDGKF